MRKDDGILTSINTINCSHFTVTDFLFWNWFWWFDSLFGVLVIFWLPMHRNAYS